MELILTLFIILFLSQMLSLLFGKINLPKLVAPIIIGTIFSVGILHNIFISKEAFTVITFIKDIAIIFLMFFVGLKIDFNHFIKSSKKSMFIALLGSLFPFLLGFLGTQIGYKYGIIPGHYNGKELFTLAYIVGICFSVTAEVVIIEILEELKVLKSIIGETIIEAGLIDSIFGVILLSGLIAFLPASHYPVQSISLIILYRILEVVLFIAVLYLLGKFFVPKIMKEIETLGNKNTNYFSVSILITLFLAGLSLLLDFGESILGAIFSGVIIRHTLLTGDKTEKHEEYLITEIIEITTFGFFAPYFLFWIGLNADFSILYTNPILAILFVGLAYLGKYVGAYLGNSLGGGKTTEGKIIAWAMNTKGEVDIMVATLMFSVGILSKTLFSSLIFMSFFTTLTAPIIFRYLIKKYHGI